MTLNDWTQCEFCLFPARYNYFKEYVEKGNECPMCSQRIKISDIKLFSELEVKQILQSKLGLIEHDETAANENESIGIKRASMQILDESELAPMSPGSEGYLNGYDNGENMLPPGLIGGSGGMAI